VCLFVYICKHIASHFALLLAFGNPLTLVSQLVCVHDPTSPGRTLFCTALCIILIHFVILFAALVSVRQSDPYESMSRASCPEV
jgi:hypothetical protein